MDREDEFKAYVGNLPYSTDDYELREMFSKYFKVLDARVIQDREMNRSRGFGFVTFDSALDLKDACKQFDGTDIEGRALKVAEATKGGRGGGGGRGGSRSGGGGYGGRERSGSRDNYSRARRDSGSYGGGGSRQQNSRSNYGCFT